MDIIIESPGFKAGENIEDYAREKFSKLHPSDNIIRANVTLYLGPDKQIPNCHCEVRLEVPGNDHFAKSAGADFYQAVDAVADILQEQLRRAREKQMDAARGRA